MMYEAAVLKLKERNYHYSCIDFSTNIHRNTDTKSQLRIYVCTEPDAIGFFTEYHKDFAGAFAELDKMLAGELPEATDEAPAGDML